MEAGKAVVDAIKQSTQPQRVDHNGFDYFDRPLHLPPAEPQAQAVELSTLQGLVDFYKTDLGDLSGYVFHVVNHQTVTIISNNVEDDRHKQRETRAVASCHRFTANTNISSDYIPVSCMVEMLLAEFDETEDRSATLDIISNITVQDVTKLKDDGVAQTLTVDKGFKVSEAKVKNLVSLTPYSTFREVPQPSRTFLLRMKKGRSETDLPTVALLRADGDGWKLTAMQSIKQWLEDALKAAGLEVTVIA